MIPYEQEKARVIQAFALLKAQEKIYDYKIYDYRVQDKESFKVHISA